MRLLNKNFTEIILIHIEGRLNQYLKTTKNDNTGIKFDNKKCHQKLKHDCNKDEVEDIILLLSKTINLQLIFSC